MARAKAPFSSFSPASFPLPRVLFSARTILEPVSDTLHSIYPVLTVREHLELSAELRGCTPRVDELLEEVGLSYAAELPGRHLSTGMRARLKFALAIQAEPPVIMFDEPGAGLDAAGRAMIGEVIEKRRAKTAFILATNDPEERRFATHELELGE